jgi:DNA-directed RNA polymerase specialized sigma24 family protein
LFGLGYRSIQGDEQWALGAHSGDDWSPLPTGAGGGRGRDEDAFGHLWHELQPALLRYFTVMAPAAAEALAAQTWLGVVDGLSRFCGSEPAFRAWVFSLARHQLLD